MVWGSYALLKVIENSTIRQSACEFLVTFYSNCVPILHNFWDIVRCQKSPILTYPTCVCHSCCGWWHWNLAKVFWQQKSRISGLSCSIVCVIVYLAVLVEHGLVTDRGTYGHGIYHASLTSRGKNVLMTVTLLWMRCRGTFHSLRDIAGDGRMSSVGSVVDKAQMGNGMSYGCHWKVMSNIAAGTSVCVF